MCNTINNTNTNYDSHLNDQIFITNFAIYLLIINIHILFNESIYYKLHLFLYLLKDFLRYLNKYLHHFFSIYKDLFISFSTENVNFVRNN